MRVRSAGLVTFAIRAWIVGVVLPMPLRAQKPNVGFAQGDSVVIVVPTVYVRERMTGWDGTNTKLDIEVRSAERVVEVFDPATKTWVRDWRTAGFPRTGHYVISKLKTVARDSLPGKFIELTLRVSPGVDYRFFAPVDHPEALGAVLASVTKSDSVRTLAYDSLGARFFTGPISSFTHEERTLLLGWAHLTANSSTIGSEAFKGVTYLSIGLPGDGSIWNNLRITRTQRLGKLIGDQLPLLKAFAKVSVPHDAIGGLKLRQPSTHGTAPDYTDQAKDDVEAYFPLDQLLKFANADITSQQLVNQSIILVNGDRVEVDLSTQ